MKLRIIVKDFSICKIENIKEVDFTDEFVFLSKTDEEISLVCDSKKIPNNSITVSKNWKALKIDEILDFSLIGILSKISKVLADNNIGIFVVSTYNTDYILIKEEQFFSGIEALRKNGHIIE